MIENRFLYITYSCAAETANVEFFFDYFFFYVDFGGKLLQANLIKVTVSCDPNHDLLHTKLTFECSTKFSRAS
jgi:hypothetical protein